MINLFSYVDRVTFELSNCCNYCHLHPKCPANLFTKPEMLPSHIIQDVLSTLGRLGFVGGFAFHRFNEPLLDPRLFNIINASKWHCPDSTIMIWTNGWNLSQQLLDELTARGVDRFYVTAYNTSEKERLSKLKTSALYRVADPHWVDVIDAEKLPVTNDRRPCLAPLTDIQISKEGYVVLCCRDYKPLYKFFDLNKGKFADVLQLDSLWDVYKRLREGDRYLKLCKRCGTSRDWSSLRSKEKVICPS